MRDPFGTILSSLDADAPRFSAAEVTTWPTVDREALQRSGILAQAAFSASIPCPGCEDHAAVVHVDMDEDDNVERYVMCPEAGRVKLDASDLCEWILDPGRIARHLSEILELKAPFREVVPTRLWRLGGVVWERVRRSVYFAVGMSRTDAASVATRLGPGGNAVLFVPVSVPPRAFWPGLPPAVVSLRDVLQLRSGRWDLDVEIALASIRETDQLNKATREGLIADPNFRKVVGAIAATKRGVPSDKDILEALELCNGNQSKAAEFLKSQHMPIHAGTISRRLDEIERKRAAEEALPQVDRGGASFSMGSTGKRRNGKKI